MILPRASRREVGRWILGEPELHFGEQVVVPDLAGWRRERLPAMPEEAYLYRSGLGVRSALPSTGRIDRGRPTVRIEPVEAIERELGRLWVDPPAPR